MAGLIGVGQLGLYWVAWDTQREAGACKSSAPPRQMGMGKGPQPGQGTGTHLRASWDAKSHRISPKSNAQKQSAHPKALTNVLHPPDIAVFFRWSKGQRQVLWSRMWPLVPRELGAPLGLGAAPPAPSPIPLGTSLLSRKHGTEPHVHPDTRASSKTPRFGKAQAFRGLLKPLTGNESRIRPILGVLLGQSFWGCFLRFGHRRSESGWHFPVGPNFGSLPTNLQGWEGSGATPCTELGARMEKGRGCPPWGGPWVASPGYGAVGAVPGTARPALLPPPARD